jgi:hypothetical protein
MSSDKFPSTSEGDSSNQKKRKKEEEFTIEVSNRFERLSEDEMEENCPEENLNINVSSKKIPPIVVHSLIRNQLASLRSVAQSLTGELQIKAKGNKTIFLAQNIEDYITLKDKVEKAKLEFHTYSIKQQKLPRMVIKNLPPNLPIEDIKEDLKQKDIRFDKITQMTKKVEDKIINLPLYIVSFQEGVELKIVLNIKSICYYKVKWEKYTNKKPITQCFKCQDYGHLATNCYRSPSCRFCGEKHESINCVKKEAPVRKCVNCNGDHSANSVDCPIYIKVLQSKMRKSRQAGPSSSPPGHSLSNPQHFPPLGRSQPPTTTPVWPRPTQPDPSSFGSFFHNIKDLFQCFDFTKIKHCLQTVAQIIKSPLDVTSKICCVIENVIDIFTN